MNPDASAVTSSLEQRVGPSAAETPQVPETPTWTLLIVAAALWLFHLRRRHMRRARGE